MSTVIKATIYEKYIYSNNGHKRLGLLENEIETRFFSSFEKYQEWYETFKSKLWQDDQNKFDLAEGTYVRLEEIPMDNIDAPASLTVHATFRKDSSYNYVA